MQVKNCVSTLTLGNQEKFLYQPDADFQIMFTEAADSPPKALNVKEEACQTQKSKQNF